MNEERWIIRSVGYGLSRWRAMKLVKETSLRFYYGKRGYEFESKGAPTHHIASSSDKAREIVALLNECDNAESNILGQARDKCRVLRLVANAKISEIKEG